MKLLLIMRGIPGSIRDEVSSEFSSQLKLAEISALNFFVDQKIRYDYTRLPEAYKYAWEQFKDLVHRNIDIVVNNTNSKKIHYRSYYNYAIERNYRVVVCQVPHPDPKEACKRSSVPEETIRRMLLEWED